MNRQLVVAKFQEDVSWVGSSQHPTVIYDRHPTPERKKWSNVQYYDLENSPRGREAHTYLFHIIQCYDSLADVTVFLQGEPRGHYPWLQPALNVVVGDTTPISYYKRVHPVCTKDTSLVCRKYQIPCILGARWKDVWWRWRWNGIFPWLNPPNVCIFSTGAQFAVPKWRIRQRPRAYYEYLLHLIESEPMIFDAWLLEVMWLHIFGDDDKGGFPHCLLRTPPRSML